MVPVLKYVRGEHLSQDHWLDMFRLLGLPRGTTLERLTFGDLLAVANTIVEKALELKVCAHTHTLMHLHTGFGLFKNMNIYGYQHYHNGHQGAAACKTLHMYW